MIGKWFIRRKIKKNLNGNRNLRLPFKTGILLTNKEFPADKSFLKKLSAVTGIPYENWDVLYLSQSETHPDFVTVLDSHINWRGQLTEPNIRKFLDKTYDLLIDLTTSESLKKQLLISHIRAGFRTGISPAHMEFYDLVIEAKGDHRGFLQELTKYFKALGLLVPASKKD